MGTALTVSILARMIDHTLLHPAASEADLAQHLGVCREMLERLFTCTKLRTKAIKQEP